MNILGKEMNNRFALWIFLHILIVIDIIFITVEMFFILPEDIVNYTRTFDLCICVVLLIQWFYTFYISRPKSIFLKKKSNWVDLIASIPFDAILPMVLPQIRILRYLRLLKLLRIFALFNRLFDGIDRFLKTSSLDKILGGVFFTIIIFTLILFIYGSNYDLFDYFYFVIVTLTTVGYGDVTPVTFNEKIITILLIFAGVFVFSTITAAISSYFTDRIINVNDKTIEERFEEVMVDNMTPVNENLDGIKKDLELMREENQELKKEINELKELIKSISDG